MTESRSNFVFRIVPRYAALPLIFALLWNTIIYNGAIALQRGRTALDMTSALENAIPFQPGWIVIYFGCYLFWAVNYILIARRGKEVWFRFLTADLLAELICGLFFVLLPTTNVRPVITDGDLFSNLTAFLYFVDPAKNLFPSIHCMASWFCWIGVRSDRRFPTWYKWFNCLFALCVCASTLFLKQHCIPDVIAGVLLAELCWFAANHTPCWRKIQTLFSPPFLQKR